MLPERLLTQDFKFKYPDLSGALNQVLGST
ncbi:MAG: DUF1731 domain-containing protein [Methylococcaceae bacterium]